jgi:ABC-type multidrug transport system ATPase subunit
VQPQPTPRASAAAPRPDLPDVVEGRGVYKEFAGRAVVRRVDFTVAAGECVGFLGPNGAGKTTTIRMITCQSPLGGGEIRVFGMPVGPRCERAIKARSASCRRRTTSTPTCRCC